MIKILGIDPGLAKIGYGLIGYDRSSLILLKAGLITTSAKLSLPERLVRINLDLNKIIKQCQPEIVAIEKLYFFKNLKTAFSVGQAWGVITYTVAKQNLQILELTPLQIKQTVTGYGQASKKQVQLMLKKIFKQDSMPSQDDTADAIACGFCATHYIKKLKI